MTVRQFYAEHGAQFDAERARDLSELKYLERAQASAPPPARVLDVGCGGGEPIARWFIERGYRVTGVDAEPSLLALSRKRFPEATWQLGDMRAMALGAAFNIVLAWDSFFHLSHDEQRGMFQRFREHTAVGGVLLFTSGPKHGTAVNPLFGTPLYHASLDPAEYRALLRGHDFDVVLHQANDPDCGGHTIWLAQRR